MVLVNYSCDYGLDMARDMGLMASLALRATSHLLSLL